MAKLVGIVEEVFGSSIILRGYTTLKNLVDVSEKPEYQRDEDKMRLDEIKEYIKNTSYRFFPELFFGWQIDVDDFIAQLRDEKAKTIKILKGISIKKDKFTFKKGEVTDLKAVTVNIDSHEKFLKRIDGNHRLCAIERLVEESNEYWNIVVPFSILLHKKGEDALKKEAAFFYLINSKSVPLTDEQNLKAIFAKGRFDDVEKKNLSIVSDVDRYENIAAILVDGKYNFVKKIFKDEVYTLSLRIFDNIDNSTSVDSIKNALVQIEALHNSDELVNNPNIIISLIVAYAKHDNDYFKQYETWLKNNQLTKIENVKPSELLSSFEELRKELNVFVAMPYFENDPSVVESYNKAYEECLQKLKNENSTLQIKLFPIMTNVGETRDINNQIFKQIDDCDIFIADITDNCNGVYLEYGYAKGLKKPKILLKSDKQDGNKPHFDLEHDSRVEYNSKDNLNDFKKKVVKNIKGILNEKFSFDFQID